MSYLSHYSYADWQSYLADGRKKYERPLYAARSWRIEYVNKFNKQSDIQITNKWVNNHPIITIHPDNTRTLSVPQNLGNGWGGTWNPLTSTNVKLTIWKFTGVDIKQRNYKHYIYEKNAKLTPSKIQGCRMCSQTGLVDGWCNAKSCWGINTQISGCPIHPDITISEVEQQRGRHVIACEHGSMHSHNVKRSQQCYSCNGTKKRDYGNKRVSVPWDGSPIKVQDGNIVRKPLTDLERMVAAYAGPTS